MIESMLAVALSAELSQPTAIGVSPPIEAQVITAKNPWLAAGLSLGSPLFLGTMSYRAFGIGAPAGFGAGQWYAGDPERAAYVSAGGMAAALTAAAWGLYGPTEGLRPRRLQNAVVNATMVSLAYGLWAGWDAFQTAQRLNSERIQPPQ